MYYRLLTVQELLVIIWSIYLGTNILRCARSKTLRSETSATWAKSAGHRELNALAVWAVLSRCPVPSIGAKVHIRFENYLFLCLFLKEFCFCFFINTHNLNKKLDWYLLASSKVIFLLKVFLTRDVIMSNYQIVCITYSFIKQVFSIIIFFYFCNFLNIIVGFFT